MEEETIQSEAGEKTHKINHFLRWGQERVKAKDRGALANLRRGFSPGTEYRCWPYIALYCYLPDETQRQIWQVIAAGFATHEQTSDCGNLGETLRKLAITGGDGNIEEALKTFDARFRRLLTCTSAIEVCKRLPSIIKAAHNKGVLINYERLFWDLQKWDKEQDKVKINWAYAYYRHGD